MAKKKVTDPEKLREVTTIVVAECKKDEQGKHFIVSAREGGQYRSKKAVQSQKAYEISPVLSTSEIEGNTEGNAGYYIFSGPLTLRGRTVATTEGRRK